MLQNSMVLPTVAPEFLADALTPKRDETCIICKVTACLIPDDGWYPDMTITGNDRDGAYMEGVGREFMDPSDTPSGWVCSKACRSQEMYQRASESQKKALRRVMDACLVIQQYGKQAVEMVEANLDGCITGQLTDGATEFLEAVGSDSAAWCEEDSPADKMAMAVASARMRLEKLSSDLGIETTCRMNDGHTWEWHNEQHARHAATCANLVLGLKEAEMTA